MTQSLPHILIVVSDFPKVTETFVLANALHYREMGHQVSIFHLKPFRHDELVHDHARGIISAGFTFGWVSLQSCLGLLWAMGRPRAFFGAVAKIIKAFWREPKRLAACFALIPKTCAMARHCADIDVDHIHAEFAGYPATSAWIAARLTGIPFSFSAHAHDIFLTQNLLVEKAQAARFVRSISVFNKRFMEALPKFPDTKIEVLRCGVKIPEEPAEALDLEEGRTLKLLFVGALLARKGADVLLQACADLPKDLNWQLDIIGGGSRDRELKDLVAKLNLPNVTFHGPKTSGEVRDAMRHAHVVVVPSREGEGGRSEGIPVVIMEALSVGRPVISTRLSGIPELIEDGVTGRLCAPDNVPQLVAAITDVATNYADAARLGQAGLLRVQQHYDITQTAEALRQKIVSSTP